MKILTYNVMEGGVKPNPSRLEKVLGVINEQDADVLALQETAIIKRAESKLLSAIRDHSRYLYDTVPGGAETQRYETAAALFSKVSPSTYSSLAMGSRIRAAEMTFPAGRDDFSLWNVYLSHVSESERLPQIREVLEHVHGKNYSVLVGDFNALSPEDGIPNSAVETFSDRMKEKYCREGKLCYDTIEAVLEAGYVDVGLKFYKPEEITGKTDLGGPKTGGGHTQGIRMDFIFAKPELLPSVKEFVMVREGLARTASDHFPWYVVLEKSLFRNNS